ncbi:hypothetical protein M409DRAFT_25613 [Zasmidium cellare ATCC 36951]|uniref:Uncharacterized protein n=1 Tax=Zasmidium cellare ATCC 36951 TaxID=1080233 RepID=A0A6A6CDI1_ZASCE|nr:uncharacterized protein M409DRAFT_25613 [Zasmidium cellare ATCC 36951]KAF2164270.1 hypothetical protein M409DRAFT_25613 [Zasmidium cellare ATCC 36951]
MVALAARIANVQAVQPNLEFTTDVKPEADVDQMCFTVFTNDGLSGFYYTFSGPWGSSNGHAGTSGSICVPTNNTAGGAAYLGTESNPGPGSTKLECFFPTTGEANCDISLVDGYSLSAGCVANNTEQIIGGYEDLNGNGIPCPDQQGPNCINTEGYAASQSDYYYFPTGDEITCIIAP